MGDTDHHRGRGARVWTLRGTQAGAAGQEVSILFLVLDERDRGWDYLRGWSVPMPR